MEKRTFLAIILSVLVLFVYQSMVSSNLNKPGQKTDIIQTVDNKEVIAVKNDDKKESFLPEEISLPQKEQVVAEETVVIENENLFVEISNIGARIKKIDIKGKETFPVYNIFHFDGFSDLVFSVTEASTNRIVLSSKKNGAEISKIYDLSNKGYEIKQEIVILNFYKMSNVKEIDIIAIGIDAKLSEKINPQEYGLYEYSVATQTKTIRKNNAHRFSSKESKTESEPVKWIGFRNKFYCSVFRPEFRTTGYAINVIDENKALISFKTDDISNSLSLKGLLYVGPQDMSLLKEAGFDDFIVFSKFWLIDMVSKAVLKFVEFTHKYIPNPGLSILLVSFLIYLAMYPLTISGMVSMKKMQSLQPKIAKLKEQHKNNPQKLNQEVMELYKQNSVNPLGGCLPFIIQMPVFIGLYQALWRSVLFDGQSFLWIKDLSKPDRLFTLPFNIPFLGNEFNILPILMMVAMFIQQKLSSKNMVITDENQAMQQKMMTMFFPIFLGVIFYKFASGLNLYFTMFYFLSAFSQYRMSKMKV